jgi:hypothetical protein
VRTVLVVVTCVALSATPLAAQRIRPSPFPTVDIGLARRVDRLPTTGARVPSEAVDAGKMILGGVLLGAGGLIGGGLIGQHLEGSPCEDCIIGPFFGALAGESLAIPLGVHLGNGRRGDVGPALAASLGIGAAGLGAALLSEKAAVLLAIPVLQIAASIAIERHTAAGNR